MTEGSDPQEPTPPAPPALPSPDPPPGGPMPSAPARQYLGLTTFTIDGRQAPALFVVGWIATLLGIGLLVARAFLLPAGIAALVIFTLGLLALAIGLVMLAGAQTIERRVAGAAYVGPSPLPVVGAGFSTYGLLGVIVGIALLPLARSIPLALGDLASVILQAAAFFGVVRLVVVGQGALTWRDMGWLGDRATVVRALLGGAVFAGPVILLTLVVARIALALGGVEPPSPLPPTGTASGLVLHLLAGAVIVPVSEELLFRGFALTAWRRLVGVRGAIVRSATVFVLAHVLLVPGDVRMAVVAAAVRVPVSLTLGWLFVRTGSIWTPIGLHATYNGILIFIGETLSGV